MKKSIYRYWAGMAICLVFLFQASAMAAFDADNDQDVDGLDLYRFATAFDPDALDVVAFEFGRQQQTFIVVENVPELMAAVSATTSGHVTVVIRDGVYNVTDRLMITGDEVTFQSLSGNRDAVILKGQGMDGAVGWIFGVAGRNFTVKDLTLGEVYYHGIQVHGELDADNLHVQNVRFYDIREQMIKGSSSTSAPYDDNGLVEDCLFEFTAGVAHQYYTGGIDIHRGRNWIVRNNTFRNIISPDSTLTEGAIHFWNDSQGTLVENNMIIDCDRGIMFGLDSSSHFGGIIRNNTLRVVRDVGIYLCNAQDAKVYNNTIFNVGYFNSIEYRFTTTGCEIINNLTNKAISSRNGGIALADNNVTTAVADWFVDAPNGDLHLKSDISGVTDQALDLSEVTHDMDGDLRQPGLSDIGADEVVDGE